MTTLGKKYTDEQKARMREAQKGHKPTAEAIQKAAEARRGKPLSAAHKEAISSKTKGRSKSPETIQRMKEARAKRSPESLRWTEERKAKQAERMKGNSFSKNPSPETRAKKSKAAKGNKNFLGKTHTEESKSKISATKTGTKLSEEHKSKISESLLGNQRTLGYKHTDEAKRKIGEAGIGRIKTPEGRARIGAASKKRFREQGMPFQLTKSTKIELVLRKIVENAGLKFIPNCKFDLFEVDVYIPKYHLAFEADGEFWHNQPGRPEKDAQRDKELLENFHLPVIRVSEDKLKQINKRDKLVTGRV